MFGYLFADSALPLNGAEYGILGVAVLFLLGLMGWLLRHVITTTLPKMHEQNTLGLGKAQDAHVAVVTKLIDTNSAEQKEARALFREETKAEREVCEKRHQENVALYQERHGEIMDGLTSNRHAANNVDNRLHLLTVLLEQTMGVKVTRTSHERSNEEGSPRGS